MNTYTEKNVGLDVGETTLVARDLKKSYVPDDRWHSPDVPPDDPTRGRSIEVRANVRDQARP